MARSLSDHEITSYDIIAPALAARIRIMKVPVLPPHVDGMTFGPYILLRSDDERLRQGDRTLLAHEMVHVRQYAELGLVGFLTQYLKSYLKNLVRVRNHRQAYLDIPQEVEARKIAERWARARQDRPTASTDDGPM